MSPTKNNGIVETLERGIDTLVVDREYKIRQAFI